MSKLRGGQVRYTDRGFSQDTDDAMKGDIVRGIIEAVTNSDDAYWRMSPEQRGKIIIEVEHRKQSSWTVRVRDRAGGIKDLVKTLTDVGARTSGFEDGAGVRGNLGRGAKDLAAFGPVSFTSICDGHFQSLQLNPDGSWDELANRKVRAADRSSLGIKRSGTVVEIQVRETFRCPRHDTLRKRLSSHYEMRGILADPKRDVQLVNLNDHTSDTLIYMAPETETVFADGIAIPGYDGVSADLRIGRLDERSDDSASDPGRTNGVVVRGQRAAYEVTLFGLESDFYAGWFEGELSCPYIEELQREFDDAFDRGEPGSVENPSRVITRQRDGLRRDHPFVSALIQAVEEPLGAAVAAERERARSDEGRLESDATRQALERAGRELARLMNEELREIEAEELLGGLTGVGEPPALAIVPETAYAYIDEDRTLTIAANADLHDPGDLVNVSVEPGGVVELLNVEIELGVHRRREDVLVAQVRLRPILAGEMTIVTVRDNADRSAAAIVEVRPKRVVVSPEVEPPDYLDFEHNSYRVGINKQKRVTLYATVDAVEEHGEVVMISSDDPGIVVRTPTVKLNYEHALGFCSTEVVLEARALGATAVVTATVGDLRATTAVKVTRKEEDAMITPRLVDEDMGSFRGIIVNEAIPDQGDRRVLKISTRHSALRPYFGQGGRGQNSPICRGIIAEVMADTAARDIVGELFRARRTTEEFDVDRFYREHYRRMARLLPPIQRMLVGDPERAWSQTELEPSPLLELEPV